MENKLPIIEIIEPVFDDSKCSPHITYWDLALDNFNNPKLCIPNSYLLKNIKSLIGIPVKIDMPKIDHIIGSVKQIVKYWVTPDNWISHSKSHKIFENTFTFHAKVLVDTDVKILETIKPFINSITLLIGIQAEPVEVIEFKNTLYEKEFKKRHENRYDKKMKIHSYQLESVIIT